MPKCVLYHCATTAAPIVSYLPTTNPHILLKILFAFPLLQWHFSLQLLLQMYPQPFYSDTSKSCFDSKKNSGVHFLATDMFLFKAWFDVSLFINVADAMIWIFKSFQQVPTTKSFATRLTDRTTWRSITRCDSSTTTTRASTRTSTDALTSASSLPALQASLELPSLVLVLMTSSCLLVRPG